MPVPPFPEIPMLAGSLCPTLAEYQDLANGTLHEADREVLLHHLESCDDCARAVHDLSARSDLSELIRHTPDDAADIGATLTRLMKRLGRLRPGDDALTSGPIRHDFLRPAEAPDELGRLGTYRVLRVLGSGGMGVVFAAEDTQLQRLVALKVLLPTLSRDESARERLLREARSAAAIRHDHIVAVYQVGEDEGVPFLAMELLDGESLERRLRREGRLPPAEVYRIGREMAEGLSAAHERGLIHRDVKPANVWLEGERGRVKLLDFGLACAARGGSPLTLDGVILGTPAYMAPEQARQQHVDPRCDLFSLGCVLYHLTTGEPPFQGADVISTLMAVAMERPPGPAVRTLGVPPGLSQLIMQLVEKEPAKRPASARTVVERIEDLERGAPVPASSEGPWRGWMWGVMGVLLFVMAGLLLAGSLMRIETPQGIVVLKTDDDDVEVKVSQGGNAVTLLDGKTRKEVTLRAGTYQLELVHGKDGLRLETKEFTLRRGEKEVARVTFEPRKAATAAESTNPDFALPTPAADAPAATGSVSWANPTGKVPLDRYRRELIPLDLLKQAGGGEEQYASEKLVAVFRDSVRDIKGGYRSVAISPDGRWLALGTRSNRVRVIDLALHNESVLTRSMSPGGATFAETKSVVFSPDSQLLAICWHLDHPGGGSSWGKELLEPPAELWRRTPKNEWRRTSDRLGVATTAQFSPDGKLLVIGSCGFSPYLQLDEVISRPGDPEATANIRVLKRKELVETPKFCVGQLSFSPDGKSILVADYDTSFKLKLLDIATGRMLREFKPPAGTERDRWCFRADSFSFSPNGERVAVIAGYEVGVWSTKGDLLRVNSTYRKATQVVFQPDNETFALAADGAILFYDPDRGVQSQIPIDRRKGHGIPTYARNPEEAATPERWFTQFAFSPDHRHVIAIDNDGLALVYRLPRNRGMDNPATVPSTAPATPTSEPASEVAPPAPIPESAPAFTPEPAPRPAVEPRHKETGKALLDLFPSDIEHAVESDAIITGFRKRIADLEIHHQDSVRRGENYPLAVTIKDRIENIKVQILKRRLVVLEKTADEFSKLDAELEKMPPDTLSSKQRMQVPFIAANCLSELGRFNDALRIYDRLSRRYEDRVEMLDALGGCVKCHAALNQQDQIRQRLVQIQEALPKMEESVRKPWMEWVQTCQKNLGTIEPPRPANLGTIEPPRPAVPQ
jgi:WD40 repeat protein